MPSFVKMTEEILSSNSLPDGRFCYMQLRSLAVQFPLSPNWKDTVIGKIFWSDSVDAFLAMKGRGEVVTFGIKPISMKEPIPSGKKVCTSCKILLLPYQFPLAKGGKLRKDECNRCLSGKRRREKLSRKFKIKQGKKKAKKKQKQQTKPIATTHDTTSYFERNIILKEMGFETYADYLISSTWKKIKNRVRKAKGKFCVICRDKATEYHHLNYGKPDLLGDTIANIVPICNVCHESIEFEDGRKLTAHASRIKFEKAMQA
jgi:hypothetical protein